MAAILTSWKEIANYLGKGVRTVQRWEREMQLPVHRPDGARQGVVLAFPAELDHWTRRDWGTRADRSFHGELKRAASTSAALLEQTTRLQKLTGTLLARCKELEQAINREGRAVANGRKTARTSAADQRETQGQGAMAGLNGHK
jgi:hypothetical protein